MKLSYDPRYNIAYIRLREKAAEVETIRVSDELTSTSRRTARSTGSSCSTRTSSCARATVAGSSWSTRPTARSGRSHSHPSRAHDWCAGMPGVQAGRDPARQDHCRAPA